MNPILKAKLDKLMANKKPGQTPATSSPVNAGAVDNKVGAVSQVVSQATTQTNSAPQASAAPAPTPVTSSPSIEEIRAKIAARKAGTQAAMVTPAKETAEEVDSLAADSSDIKNTFSISPELAAIEGFQPEKFMANLQKLEEGVKANAPGIVHYLKDIHDNLTQYQELVHLLDDDKIAIIVSGFLKQTNTEMAKVATKKGSKKVLTLDEAQQLF